MYIRFKSVFVSFAGTSIGIILFTVLKGLWTDSFDWDQCMAMIIGGLFAHVLLTTLIYWNAKRNTGEDE
ncbi:hypothetical protein GWK91_01990 [Virgibacillus sp. MSP4-1]|uniref:hypothetical protein n=1 Tax=Virgibacillus sp. MSP4-1 TaxID=2700081 RepID=UPI00039FFAFA|nr:hypothetical protein [Virgibacillus sp. MSP4-1]QHS21788.1 hypothetical protein GWK91_01990 [Virgibacillus sp. MSP4-1]